MNVCNHNNVNGMKNCNEKKNNQSVARVAVLARHIFKTKPTLFIAVTTQQK